MEKLLTKQVEMTAKWVYSNRVFFHDGVTSKKPKEDDFFGNKNSDRFHNFALLYVLRRFAEKDLAAWKDQASLLDGALAGLQAHQPMSEPAGGVTAQSSESPGEQVLIDNPHGGLLRKKRGRPAKIPDALKERALGVKGGKARAQILYGIRFPTPQQVKNVPAILRHYSQSRKPK